MSKKAAQLQAALRRIDERWDETRTERTLGSLHDKHRLRRRRRQTLSAAAAVGVLILFGFWLHGAPATVAPVASGATTSDLALLMRLADGSQVTLRDAQSRVIAHEQARDLVELELVAGQARFDVTPNKQRLFRVRSADVTVEVLGTAFEIEREAVRSHVVVLRGRVAVFWPGGRTELSAGEAGWFPRADVGETATSALAAAGATAAAPGHNPRHKRTAAPAAVGGRRREAAETGDAERAPAAVAVSGGWRETAEAGDFDRAYELMQNAPAPRTDSVEELLLAADTARLSGHPKAALPFLKRVIAEHAYDSRAPLAAFTLGGILMQQLGQPREAEAAYAQARELSPSSALAEDALARQVEAAFRAGDSARATRLAGEYLERYPSGRRVHAVQRFGNLSAD